MYCYTFFNSEMESVDWKVLTIRRDREIRAKIKTFLKNIILRVLFLKGTFDHNPSQNSSSEAIPNNLNFHDTISADI